jgi:hypothetical protein
MEPDLRQGIEWMLQPAGSRGGQADNTANMRLLPIIVPQDEGRSQSPVAHRHGIHRARGIFDTVSARTRIARDNSGKLMRTALKQHQVKTKRPVKGGVTPRMPHERDESEDSQESVPRDDMKQAYQDLQQGQVDTDLRETGGVDEVVNDRPGTPPEKVVKKSVG